MQRFPKEARLKSAAEFDAVKRCGVRARVEGLSVAAVRGEGQRLGLVVSRRAGPAVQRNRIKRVVREFFRLHRGLFPQGDCVVIAAPGASKLSNEEIRERLGLALKKLKSISDGR